MALRQAIGLGQPLAGERHGVRLGFRACEGCDGAPCCPQ